MGARLSGGRSRTGRAARVFFTLLGAGCVLCAVLAGLILRGALVINTPSRDRYPVWGVDVSHYQGEIDWNALREQGVRFAYIKATEGSSHVDGRFLENARGAREAGVPAGAYHFFSFESPGSTQAQNLLAALEGVSMQLPCAVDVEFYGAFFENPPEVATTRAQLRNLLDAIEAATGARPLLYATNRSYRMYLKGAFDDYPLWIRDVYLWPWLTAPGRDWTLWQYSDKGRLEGYAGEEEHIDLNVFAGDEAAFDRFCTG